MVLVDLAWRLARLQQAAGRGPAAAEPEGIAGLLAAISAAAVCVSIFVWWLRTGGRIGR